MNKALLMLGISLSVIGLVAACGGAATPSPTLLPPTAALGPSTATAPPPTATSPPPPTSTPEEVGLEKHKFKFIAPLGTQEEGERIESVLTTLPGISEASVTEISISIEYDPDVIALEGVQEAIESLGYKVEP